MKSSTKVAPHAQLDTAALLRWYSQHKRPLPWRNSSDPYPIWVSEVMLQQTRVTTVIPYFERWMARFPTVEDLASSPEQSALALWQGLGYYRRCKLLRAGALWVVERGVPQSYAGWLGVPGVGPYTAAAIASICLGEPIAVADGNVKRVYARQTCDSSTGAALDKSALRWAAGWMEDHEPGEFNQALMELGATVCTPRSPTCFQCPLKPSCSSAAQGKPENFPRRPPKRQPERVVFEVWAPVFEGKFGIHRVPPGPWWQGLWEFPRAEVGPRSGGSAGDSLRQVVGPGWVEDMGDVSHHVSRFRIECRASLVRCDAPSPLLEWYDTERLSSVPLPALSTKVLKLALKHLGVNPSGSRREP